MKPTFVLLAFLALAALPWACGSHDSNPTTPGAISTSTFTPVFTPTGSFTPTLTSTKTPSSTPTNSPTSTPTNSPTNTATPTISPTAIDSPTNTPTNTLTATATNSPTPTPTNTPAPIGVTFSVVNPSIGVYRYSTTGTGGVSITAPITISVGTSAVWDNSNGGIHPLWLDDSSSCVIPGQVTGFPITQVFSVGTYHFHCGNHGSCSPLNSSCPPTSCAAMTGTLVVQ